MAESLVFTTLRPRVVFVLAFAIEFTLGVIGVMNPACASPGSDYMLQCQGCHGADGRGSPGSVPDLRDQLGLYLEVEGGREFLIRVPGSAQSNLADAQLAEVLNWMIRKFGPAEVSASFEPFTAKEIARNRKPLADVESVRALLMSRIVSGR